MAFVPHPKTGLPVYLAPFTSLGPDGINQAWIATGISTRLKKKWIAECNQRLKEQFDAA